MHYIKKLPITNLKDKVRKELYKILMQSSKKGLEIVSAQRILFGFTIYKNQVKQFFFWQFLIFFGIVSILILDIKSEIYLNHVKSIETEYRKKIL